MTMYITPYRRIALCAMRWTACSSLKLNHSINEMILALDVGRVTRL
jgi:hypothetical protein